MPEGAGPLGLGELGATMEEGYQPRSYGTFDPEPTEWGPVEKDPFGDYREMEYGTDSAQMPKGSRAVAEHQSPKEDFKGFLQDLYNTPLSSWTKRPEDKEALGALGKKLFTPDLHPAIDRYRTQRYGQER